MLTHRDSHASFLYSCASVIGIGTSADLLKWTLLKTFHETQSWSMKRNFQSLILCALSDRPLAFRYQLTYYSELENMAVGIIYFPRGSFTKHLSLL